MTKETYFKIRTLIVEFGDARFNKGVAPLNSGWEEQSRVESEKIFKEINEILSNEVN